MAELSPLFNSLFHHFRSRLLARKERGEYSGGWYAARIREVCAEELAGRRGLLLDLGSGEGLLCDALRERDCPARVIGLEPWPRMLRRHRQRIVPPLPLVRGDGLALPFRDSSFSAVACVNLLLNLADTGPADRLLQEALRVLEPGGLLIFDLRNGRNLLHRLRYRLARCYDETLRTPLRTDMPGRVEAVLAAAGGRVLRRQGIGMPTRGGLAPILLYTVKRENDPAAIPSPGRRLIPAVSAPVKVMDALHLLRTGPCSRRRAEREAASWFSQPLRLVGSGQVALWLILRLLREEKPRRSRVLLPAYTAPSVFVTIQAAGLDPVPVDVDPADLDFCPQDLAVQLEGDPPPLALIRVHPFGVPLPLDRLTRFSRLAADDVTLVEDAAQSLGSRLPDGYAGTVSGLGFSSLNRGKNLPVDGGALLFCRDPERLARLDRMIAELSPPPVTRRALLPLTTLAYALAIRPEIYGPAQSLIRRQKQTAPPAGVDPWSFSPWQSRLFLRLLPRLVGWNASRRRHAAAYFRGLSGLPGLELFLPPAGVEAAWNRFPLRIADAIRREKLEEGLAASGVEASRLYRQAIPDHFPAAVGSRSFPGARRFARELLTLPLMPDLSPADRERIVTRVREFFPC